MYSIWEQDHFPGPQDVVVAGAGFAGLWTAFHLKQRYPKARVAVLEKDFMPMGASTRNAGFACFGSPGELIADAGTMGVDTMLKLVELRYRGLQLIEKHFRPSKIDLDWCGGYELFPEGSTDADRLREDLTYLNTLLRPVTHLRETFTDASGAIGSFGFGATAHLVLNRAEGALHSGRLAERLRRELRRQKVQWLTGIAVTGFQDAGNFLRIDTNQGIPLQARYLAVCTNTGTGNLLPEINVTPARGQVLLTSPIAGLPWKGTFHADEGYYYFRNLGERVLLGGARNKAFEAEGTDERCTTPFIQEELERFLNSVVLPRYQGRFAIEHRWAGIMGMGASKHPVIGQVRPRVFAATALGGIGVAVAPEAGRLLARQIEL